jgi:uncharacterized protein
MPPPAPLLIDGHNLIGKLPGISLREIDDETRLVNLLQIFSRVRRKRIEVYFDGAPPGQSGTRAFGTIQAVFVPLGNSADAAIRARLTGLGKQARNTTVVTSDRQVQADARACGSGVIPSEDFARDLLAAAESASAAQKPDQSGRASTQSGRSPRSQRSPQSRRGANESAPPLSPKEVDEWMNLFEKGKSKKK